MTTFKELPHKTWKDFAPTINSSLRRYFAHWCPDGAVVRCTATKDWPDSHPLKETQAWYDEDSSILHVNIDLLEELLGSAISSPNRGVIKNILEGTNPTVYLGDRTTKRHAVAAMTVIGLVMHETAHARWSTWRPHPAVQDATPVVFDAMVMMEELRIERMALDHAERQRPTVGPKQALPFVYDTLLKQIGEVEVVNQAQLAGLWALVHGRVISGVLAPAETESIDEAVRNVLGDDDVDYMCELLAAAVVVDTTTDHGVQQLRELAEEWVATVGDPTSSEGGGEAAPGHGHTGCGEGAEGQTGKIKGSGEPDEGAEGEGSSGSDDKADDDDDDEADGEGSGSDGEGEDEDEDEDEGDDGDAKSEGSQINDADNDTEHGEGGTYDDTIAHGNGGGVSPNMRHIIADAVKEASYEWLPSVDTKRKPADPNVVAPKVFGQKPLEHAGKAGFTTSKPSAQTRAAVAKLTAEFEKVALPQVVKTPTRMSLPPGRLNTREAVRRSAERSRGQMVTAQPWRGEKRRHTTAKPLVVGLATDTSGSMGWAEQMVAEAAYVFAHAGSRIGARTAAVTFGNHAEAVVKPGNLPREVITRSANGGSEDFDNAAAALDGVLHLGHNDGSAKFVCVISDAQLVRPGEIRIAEQWLDRWIKAGTYILWVGAARHYSGTNWLKDRVTYVDIAINEVRKNPAKLVEAIGPKLQEAMRPKS